MAWNASSLPPHTAESPRLPYNCRRMTDATIEIAIDNPTEKDEQAWTLSWNGEEAHVHPAPGIDAGELDDWGFPYTSRDYTDPWRTEGGDAYVIEQLLAGFGGCGFDARIVAVHGDPGRERLLQALRDFAEQYPHCTAELRRFALEEKRTPPPSYSSGREPGDAESSVDSIEDFLRNSGPTA